MLVVVFVFVVVVFVVGGFSLPIPFFFSPSRPLAPARQHLFQSVRMNDRLSVAGSPAPQASAC